MPCQNDVIKIHRIIRIPVTGADKDHRLKKVCK